MSRWEHRYLGQERFPNALSAMEVEHFFTLGQDELAAVRRRRTNLNRLALALQIGFLKLTGGTLNSVEIIPTAVLGHLGRQLGCAPPRIASIRALYRRRRTLFDHQAYLRREAAAVFDNVELMTRSRSWLVDHDYLVLRERDIRRLVGAARRHQEQKLWVGGEVRHHRRLNNLMDPRPCPKSMTSAARSLSLTRLARCLWSWR
jgi:hypothetical protein